MPVGTYRSAAGGIASTPDAADLAGGAGQDDTGHGLGLGLGGGSGSSLGDGGGGGSSQGDGAEEGDGGEEDGGELHFEGWVGFLRRWS